MQKLHLHKWLKIPKTNPPSSSIFTSSLSKFIPNHPILTLLEQAQCHHKHLDLKSLHAHTITSGLIADPFAASRVIQFFLQQNHDNNLDYPVGIFNSLRDPDVYTWNLMIASHIESGFSNSSIEFYFRMRTRRTPPNAYTFALVVKACSGNGGSLRLVHGQVVKCGVEDLIVIKNSLLSLYCNLGLLNEAQVVFEKSIYLDLISWNILISAYGKNGHVEIAARLFERMPNQNLISWSALIDGYVRSGNFFQALRLFYNMQAKGLKPDVVTLVSVLKACAHLGALDQGREIHRYIDIHGVGGGNNVALETALVDMYCKCGCIGEARNMFDTVLNKDIVLWNAMISGLAMHGESLCALELFQQMKKHVHNPSPNKSTYISVLCACKHAGLVNEGVVILEEMKKHGLEPEMEHYGCVTDLLGRAGRVREAEELLNGMPMGAQASQWGALMQACRMHREIEVCERVGRRLIELEPFDAGRYVLLANLYADLGEWEKAKEIRREMEEIGAKKETGVSSIEHKLVEA